MEFQLNCRHKYQINHPEKIMTPRLLVFEDRVQSNIDTMKAALEAAVPGSGFSLLCAHVKTHKSSLILKRLMHAGVSSFKVSLNEVELCLKAGVPEIFVAYPLLEDRALWLDDLMTQFPDTSIIVQIGSLEQAVILREAALKTGRRWQVMLDIDVGMHRTGISPSKALALYKEVHSWPEINMTGLHGYDGHIHQMTVEERRKASKEAMNSLVMLFEELAGAGIEVPRIMTAGSPSFLTDLEVLTEKLVGKTRVQVSPGTWIYWDSGYNKLMPGAFNMSALILARVLERHENRLTLNLGHKRWAADQGPVELFSIKGATIYSFNEEHTVVSVPADCQLSTGDYVLVAPRHVCSTVNLWEYYALMDGDGGIIDSNVPVYGRNR
ncbi:alanine racemase [bacterium]|nr:alanine racemase [bacterium]